MAKCMNSLKVSTLILQRYQCWLLNSRSVLAKREGIIAKVKAMHPTEKVWVSYSHEIDTQAMSHFKAKAVYQATN